MPPNTPLPDLSPMEARAVAALPTGPGWWFEPKWDGFRCLALKAGGQVDLRGRSGKSLTRYFPEVAAALAAAAPDHFVIDGELLIAAGPRLSFGALQDRLHPAESRVRRLAAETPAFLMGFDCLAAGGELLAAAPLPTRRAALDRLTLGPTLRRTPWTTDRAEAETWLARTGDALDGVIAKRADAPYAPGERAMLKVKRLRTADCVVGGFRYGTGATMVGSLLLGLYDADGRLNHVGFTSGIAARDKPSLTARLQALRGAPGFTGDSPGGPSRWSTARSADWVPLRPELVAEVQYDHVNDGKFRHGTAFLRWRPDRDSRSCRETQLHAEAAPAGVFGA